MEEVFTGLIADKRRENTEGPKDEKGVRECTESCLSQMRAHDQAVKSMPRNKEMYLKHQQAESVMISTIVGCCVRKRQS